MDKPNRPPRKKKHSELSPPVIKISHQDGSQSAFDFPTRNNNYFMQETANHFLSEFYSLFTTIDRLEERMEQNKYSDRQVSTMYLGSRLDVHSSDAIASYENELEERLQKMIRVSSMLKYMCKREQHHRIELVKAVKMCFERCTLLLDEMTVGFQQKYLQAQDVIRANTTKLTVSQQQLAKTRLVYETLLNQASQSIDILEGELKKEHDRNKELTAKVSELEQTVQTLTLQNEALTQKLSSHCKHTFKGYDGTGQNSSADTVFKKDILDVTTEEAVMCLKQEASDKAWKHIETLLEIAVSRLRMHEQDSGILHHNTPMTLSMSSDTASCDTSLNSTYDSTASMINRSNASLDTPVPHAPPRRRGKYAGGPLRKAVSSEGILDKASTSGYGSTQSLASHLDVYKTVSESDQLHSEKSLSVSVDKSDKSYAAPVPKAPKRRKSFASRSVSVSSQDSKDKSESEKKEKDQKGQQHIEKGHNDKGMGTANKGNLHKNKRDEQDIADEHESNKMSRGDQTKGYEDREKDREGKGTEQGLKGMFKTHGSMEPRRRKRLNKRRAKTMVNFFRDHITLD